MSTASNAYSSIKPSSKPDGAEKFEPNDDWKQQLRKRIDKDQPAAELGKVLDTAEALDRLHDANERYDLELDRERNRRRLAAGAPIIRPWKEYFRKTMSRIRNNGQTSASENATEEPIPSRHSNESPALAPPGPLILAPVPRNPAARSTVVSPQRGRHASVNETPSLSENWVTTYTVEEPENVMLPPSPTVPLSSIDRSSRPSPVSAAYFDGVISPTPHTRGSGASIPESQHRQASGGRGYSPAPPGAYIPAGPDRRSFSPASYAQTSVPSNIDVAVSPNSYTGGSVEFIPGARHRPVSGGPDTHDGSINRSSGSIHSADSNLAGSPPRPPKVLEPAIYPTEDPAETYKLGSHGSTGSAGSAGSMISYHGSDEIAVEEEDYDKLEEVRKEESEEAKMGEEDIMKRKLKAEEAKYKADEPAKRREAVRLDIFRPGQEAKHLQDESQPHNVDLNVKLLDPKLTDEQLELLRPADFFQRDLRRSRQKRKSMDSVHNDSGSSPNFKFSASPGTSPGMFKRPQSVGPLVLESRTGQSTAQWPPKPPSDVWGPASSPTGDDLPAKMDNSGRTGRAASVTSTDSGATIRPVNTKSSLERADDRSIKEYDDKRAQDKTREEKHPPRRNRRQSSVDACVRSDERVHASGWSALRSASLSTRNKGYRPHPRDSHPPSRPRERSYNYGPQYNPTFYSPYDPRSPYYPQESRPISRQPLFPIQPSWVDVDAVDDDRNIDRGRDRGRTRVRGYDRDRHHDDDPYLKRRRVMVNSYSPPPYPNPPLADSKFNDDFRDNRPEGTVGLNHGYRSDPPHDRRFAGENGNDIPMSHHDLIFGQSPAQPARTQEGHRHRNYQQVPSHPNVESQSMQLQPYPNPFYNDSAGRTTGPSTVADEHNSHEVTNSENDNSEHGIKRRIRDPEVGGKQKPEGDRRQADNGFNRTEIAIQQLPNREARKKREEEEHKEAQREEEEAKRRGEDARKKEEEMHVVEEVKKKELQEAVEKEKETKRMEEEAKKVEEAKRKEREIKEARKRDEDEARRKAEDTVRPTQMRLEAQKIVEGATKIQEEFQKMEDEAHKKVMEMKEWAAQLRVRTQQMHKLLQDARKNEQEIKSMEEEARKKDREMREREENLRRREQELTRRETDREKEVEKEVEKREAARKVEANLAKENSNMLITGGTFNRAAGNININQPAPKAYKGIDKLYSKAVSEAFHDAPGRLECHPNNRDVAQEIIDWVDDLDSPELVMWLHGAAGTGKSGVAHTIGQKLYQQARLSGSFIFARGGTTGLGHERKLVPTLAYQLAQYVPATWDHIGMAVLSYPAVFDNSLPSQAQILLSNPLFLASKTVSSSSNPSHRLFIIDGLDEFHDAGRILLDFTSAVMSMRYHLPHKLLITSRSEKQLVAIFNAHKDLITSKELRR